MQNQPKPLRGPPPAPSPSNSPRLIVGGKVFQQHQLHSGAAAQALQAAMDAGKRQFGHALCTCRRQPLRLQLRLREGKYHLAVWPQEGHLHDTECEFFRDELAQTLAEKGDESLPPAGKAKGPSQQVRAPAQQHPRAPVAPAEPVEPVEPRTRFALVMPGQRRDELDGNGSQAGATATPTPASTGAGPAPTTINLKTLAMMLWRDASLCRWHPGWDRDWGRTRFQINEVAKTMDLNGAPLDQVLFAPRPFRESVKDVAAIEWDRFTRALAHGRDLPFLVIAPVRQITRAASGATIARLSHVRNPIGLSEPAARFLNYDCRASLRLAEEAVTGPNKDAKPVNSDFAKYDAKNLRQPTVMGFFLVESNSRGGVWARAAWLFNVHPRFYIPTANRNEMLLVDTLIEEGHAFERLLSPLQPIKRTTPDWLVRHVIGPDGKAVARAALELFDKGSTEAYLQARAAVAADLAGNGVPTWRWSPGYSWAQRQRPNLPPLDSAAAHAVATAMSAIASDPHTQYHYGPSPISTAEGESHEPK